MNYTQKVGPASEELTEHMRGIQEEKMKTQEVKP